MLRQIGIFFILLFALIFTVPFYVMGGLPSKLTHSVDAPIDISADNFSTESSGLVRADGNVLIRQGDMQLTADHVLANRETGEITARGNVILVRKNMAALRSEIISFNYKTGEGLAPSLDVQAGVLRVISDKVRMRSDGIFDLRDVLVTTCTNHPGHLHYAIRGKRALYSPGEYVELSDMTLRFNGAPLFYFPWWKRSFTDHYGWRFDPGYESDWGAYLLATYKRQLIDFGGEFKDSLDSRTHIDYRTERGFALGQDFAWHFGRPDLGHKGFVAAYGIWDEIPMDKDLDRVHGHDIVEEERYRFTFRHDSYLSGRDYLTLRTSYLSDSYLLADFFEDEYKSLIQPDSFVTYTHSGDGWSAGLGAYHRVNKFYESVNRLPDAWFDSIRTQIGSSPFYYESQTRAGILQREFADYGIASNLVADAYDTFRFDTRQAVYFPKTYFGFLSFVPRGVYRGTFYGDTLERVESEDASGPESYLEDSAQLRNIFELGFETAFKTYGLFNTASGRVRHVIEPYINYTYIPEPNLRPYNLLQFDRVDTLDKTHTARIGTRQMLQRKIGDSIVSLLDADLYGIYEFENDEDDPGLATLGVDLRLRPADTIRIELEAEYDVPQSEIDFIDLWMTLWNGDRWEAAGQCFYRPDETTLLTGAVTCNINETWGVNLYSRFEAELSRMEEIAGYVQYNLDCLSFRFKTAYQPAFTRDDGTEREAKVKLGFYVWLRAYAPERYERHLRDGAF